MADVDDSLDSLRLALMHEVLPVGMAMMERVRSGGASKVVEVFSSSSDPLQDLRDEGELAAKSLRERLDQVSPGLGNPVMPVKVAVNDEMDETAAGTEEDKELQQILSRIEERLDALQAHFPEGDI